MGYYSDISWEFEVEEVDLKEFEKFKEKFGFYNPVITDSGNLDFELEDTWAKHYEYEELAEHLSKVIKKGKATLYFDGEDGESWICVITPGLVHEYNSEKYYYPLRQKKADLNWEDIKCNKDINWDKVILSMVSKEYIETLLGEEITDLNLWISLKNELEKQGSLDDLKSLYNTLKIVKNV